MSRCVLLPVAAALAGAQSWKGVFIMLLQGEGITTPGSGIAISKTAVRGVDSFGMLCSAYDIGWSDEADGILVIMPDTAQPGEPCPAEPPQVIFFCCCFDTWASLCVTSCCSTAGA